MASYTIDGRTYNSFQNFKEGGYRKTRGHLLALTKKRDKFLDDPDATVRKTAELIKRHDQWDISNEDIMYETMMMWSFSTCILIPYIRLHIRLTGRWDMSDGISAVVDANIDPNDAERWGDEPKTKPYSEYTLQQKLTCIKRLANQWFREDLYADWDTDVRLTAYQLLGRDEVAKQDENWLIRLEAYRALGRDSSAKKDADYDIRIAAYQQFGREEDAKADTHWKVRREAYRMLGRTKDALDDEDQDIRKDAKTYYSTVGKRADE